MCQLTDKLEIYFSKTPEHGMIDYSPDSVGDYYKTIFSQKIDLTSNEFMVSKGESEKEIKKFRIRFNRSIKKDMIVKYEGGYYRITGKLAEDKKSRNRWNYLICEMIR